MWKPPMQQLIYGHIERRVVYISKGFIVVIHERVMATKNYCRHVRGEGTRVGGWYIKSCQAGLWFHIFMLLLTPPAISLKCGSIKGSVQGSDNGRGTSHAKYPLCAVQSHLHGAALFPRHPDGPLTQTDSH